MFYSIAEAPCKIIMPLKDLDVMENGLALLFISLSKPRNVVWMKDSSLLDLSDERFKRSSSEDNLEHTLKITGIRLEESCNITAQVDDLNYGVLTSDCKISVQGEFASFRSCRN